LNVKAIIRVTRWSVGKVLILAALLFWAGMMIMMLGARWVEAR